MRFEWVCVKVAIVQKVVLLKLIYYTLCRNAKKLKDCGVHWRQQRHLQTHQGVVWHTHKTRGSAALLAYQLSQIQDCTGGWTFEASSGKKHPIWGSFRRYDRAAGGARQRYNERAAVGVWLGGIRWWRWRLMRVWEVNNSMKMRDSNVEARRLLESSEDILPYFRHPKIRARQSSCRWKPVPNCSAHGRWFQKSCRASGCLLQPSSLWCRPSSSVKWLLVSQRLFWTGSPVRDGMVLSIQEKVKHMCPQDKSWGEGLTALQHRCWTRSLMLPRGRYVCCFSLRVTLIRLKKPQITTTGVVVKLSRR